MMTMHVALHPRYDTDSLYVLRKGGGRGLVSSEECKDTTIQGLENALKRAKTDLITTIINNV